MPRSDSGDSSGASLTSEEIDEVLPTEQAPVAPAVTLVPPETTPRSRGIQRFRQAVSKVSMLENRP